MKEKSGLPIWARVLAGLVLIGGVAAIVLFTSAIYYFNGLAKQAGDPNHIAQVSKSIADFPAKLPDGFSYQMAATILGVNMVTVFHKADNTVLMIGAKTPSEAEAELSARQIANDLADKGIPNVSDELQIDKNSSLPLAGYTMEYVTGSSSDKEGHPISGMIGCISVKDKNKLVLIYGLSPSKSYNFEQTKTLLSTIKGF